MKTKIILSVLLSAIVISSCVKDLDVKPKDPNTILAGNLSDDPVYMQQVLGKIYASFMISGQGANGGDDIAASDGNFFTTMRALWNLQEITTDEAICAWGDVGIADLNTQTWSPSNPFLTAVYQRLSLSVTYANDFIKLTKDNTDPAVVRYNAEARFLRALAYYWLMDLFGNPPFTTEEDGVGKYYPRQIQRAQLFNYVAGELKAIENLLNAPGTGSSSQATQGACWMLQARLYLNAKTFINVDKYDSCVIYTKKVIESNKYQLATDYRRNFSADNNYAQGNKEMVFGWEQDGVNTQGYVGTTFLIESSSDATYLRAEDYHGLTSNTNWNGNRARKNFAELFVGDDNVASYLSDPTFSAHPDNRIYLKIKKEIDIPSASSSGDYGIGVYKFTARKANGSQADNYNPAFASTDFPIFRYADALLMYAEAVLRGATNGTRANALAYVNLVRERAYGNTDGNIADGDLDIDFIFEERSREFYYEAQRRTDLVRFGKFTGGTYLWQWKGGAMNGTSTATYRNLFPIPGDEISANPNIQQNEGY